MAKTLDDIQNDMSELYERLKANEVQREDAAELANIAGKYLKAEQLKLGREIFVANLQHRLLPSNPARQLIEGDIFPVN